MGGGGSSGGSGNASNNGGVRSVKEANNFAELEQYMNDNYNISITDDVKKLNFNAVKTSLQGVEDMMNDYPELKDSITTIKTSKTGVMSCGGASINFNPKYYSGADADVRLNEMAKGQSNAKWWPANASSQSLGVHETAHALVWQMTKSHVDKMYSHLSPDARERMTRMLWNDGTVAKQIVDTANKRAKKADYGKGKSVRALAESTSGYANHYNKAGARAHEIIAESFADVRTNGNSAAEYSKEVYKAANEYYKA